jgi:UDP-N-acetylglucosamine--N-acetylmuramyl-(pentapeptide) pyrophosphoryl-undecaprenol N-acetylglucosamine transferase
MAKKLKIAFAGGGTGGHVIPLIAVAREIRRLYTNDNLALHYIGPYDQLGKTALLQEDVKIHSIVSGKIRRYFSFLNIIDILFSIPFATIQSFFLLLFMRPDLLFSKGGTGAIPVAFCAKILGIPIFIHESDVVPGLSNKTISRWAKKIFISFDKTEYFDLSQAISVGNPIKKELLEGSEASAKEVFNLTLEKPVILFLGGSQGAQPLNDFILLLLNDLLKEYEVIHSCGLKNIKKMAVEANLILPNELKKYYHAYGTLDEIQLKHALKVAQLVVSRAGSGSIFEIAAAGKPSILIPLPGAAQNHQSKNAYQYSATGAAIIIEQENLTPNFFMGKINHILAQPAIIEDMKNAALAFSKPLAAKAIAREILEYIHANV